MEGRDPFSAKRGRCPKGGWGAESKDGSMKVRCDGLASRPGAVGAGHTPSGAPRHLPRFAEKGFARSRCTRIGQAGSGSGD